MIKNIGKERDYLKIINIDDNVYPELLRKIKNPPKQLYTMGNTDLLNETNIAIVGTRHCTNYGFIYTKKFTKEISNLGINIVSGMAIGIDSIAHKTCILTGNKTIAVLPSGFNNIYPKQNIDLFHSIINSGGLAITEYPPEFEATKNSFAARNRIVAGISMCTVVIEAAYRSGTSITARECIDQGKYVFAVPGNLENRYSVGTNILIRNGAFLLSSTEDILDAFPHLRCLKKKKTSRKIPDEYKNVYDNITEIAISIDELKHKLNIDIATLTSQLTILEIDGYILQLPNGSYIKNE